MDRAKAQRLLEMLRRRTEARGATPAEAAQAAELAAKIIERYGLDAGSSTSVKGAETGERRFPIWASIVAYAIEQRFSVRGNYVLRPGRNSAVRFEGPEHTVGVACWLFRAIEVDMRAAADRSAAGAAVRGPAKLRFKNQFLKSCACTILGRMLPPSSLSSIDDAGEHQCSSEPTRRRKKRPPRLSDADLLAMIAGKQAGLAIPISADVLPDGSRAPQLRIAEAAR